MKYTTKIQQAIRFAVKTHEVYQKQKRKGKDIGYIVHPMTAGIILALVGASEDVIVAGILHDTIEDSVEAKKVTKLMLAERFGENVSRLVSNVTEHDKQLSWEQRKEEALLHIDKFDQDSLLVKSADIISNVSELTDDYKKIGDQVFLHFNAPKERMLEHQLKVIDTILKAWPQNPFAKDLLFLTKELQMIEVSKVVAKNPFK